MLDEAAVIRLTLAVWERFGKMRERVEMRRAHFHRDESAAPKFDKDSGIENDFQTHLLTTTWRALKARETENHFVVAAEPLKKSDGGKTKAELMENVLNIGIDHVERRNGWSLQSALSDGQIVDGFSLLHWRKADETYPAVPEWEYADELEDPDDPEIDKDERVRRKEKAERFEEEEYEEKGEKKTRYKETGKSYLERVKQQRAKAGFPYAVEVYTPLDSAFISDKAGGLGTVVTMQKVPLIDYRGEQEGQKFRNKPIHIALDQGNKKLRVYREEGKAPSDTDEAMQYTEHVTVACLWTRGEWHEMACVGDVPPSGESGGWEYIKGGAHQWGEPPFSLVVASEFTGERVPEKRYMPALHDMFDMKGMADKFVALFLALGERTVVKDVYLQNAKGGPSIAEDGTPIEIGPAGSMEGQRLPDGFELKSLEHDISGGFVAGLELVLQHLRDSAPDTGKAEIAAGTKPWTARLGLQMANVYPKQLMTQQMLGIERMAISIAQDMSQRKEKVWVHQSGRDVIAVEPEDIPGLKISVNIMVTSSAERVVEEEHGRELLNDPLFPLTPEMCLERYFAVEDPHGQVVEYDAWDMFTRIVKPGLMQAEAAKRYGWKAYITPGMEFVGTDGQPRTSEQVVQGSDQGMGSGNPDVGQMASPQQQMSPLGDAGRPPGVTPQMPLGVG